MNVRLDHFSLRGVHPRGSIVTRFAGTRIAPLRPPMKQLATSIIGGGAGAPPVSSSSSSSPDERRSETSASPLTGRHGPLMSAGADCRVLSTRLKMRGAAAALGVVSSSSSSLRTPVGDEGGSSAFPVEATIPADATRRASAARASASFSFSALASEESKSSLVISPRLSLRHFSFNSLTVKERSRTALDGERGMEGWSGGAVGLSSPMRRCD